MGVRGLLSYVYEHKDELLVPYKLHDETVVIDGDNLIYRLSNTCKKLNPAFGGDYEKYAGRVTEFFETLSSCGVSPVVLLDGGSHPSKCKLKTSFKRLEEKQEKAKKLSPSNQNRISLLPFLAKATFIQVLRRLAVPYAVCAFEADASLAALARWLDCAVVSDDTDFFAFGVRCVLLGSLSEEVESASGGGRCLDCVQFLHKRFMERCGLRPALLPLLGCLAGNDYISPVTLRQFLLHLPRPYGQRGGSNARRRIRGLLLWLRRHTSPEEALQEVLSQIRKEDRGGVRALLERSLCEYRRPPSIRLSGLSPPPPQTTNVQEADSASPADSAELNASGIYHEDRDLTLHGNPLPQWLRDCLRHGQVTCDVTNLITGHPLLLEPQVEDPRSPAAGACALPLLRWMLLLLRGADAAVTVYQRSAGGGRCVARGLLRASEAATPHAPSLSSMPELSEHERRRCLLAALEVPAADVAALPAQLQLPAAAVGFWRRHSVAPVTACHLGALLTSHMRHQVAVTSLCRPDPALVSGEKRLDRRLAHQWAELQVVLAAAGNVNALLNGPLPPVAPDRLLGGPVLYNASWRLLRLGAAEVETWFAPDALREWKRLLQLLCQVSGVAMDMKANCRTRAGSTPGSGAAAAGEPAEEQTGDGVADTELGSHIGQLEICDQETRRKSAREQPPQLRNNPFSALVSDSGDSSDESL